MRHETPRSLKNVYGTSTNLDNRLGTQYVLMNSWPVRPHRSSIHANTNLSKEFDQNVITSRMSIDRRWITLYHSGLPSVNPQKILVKRCELSSLNPWRFAKTEKKGLRAPKDPSPYNRPVFCPRLSSPLPYILQQKC